MSSTRQLMQKIRLKSEENFPKVLEIIEKEKPIFVNDVDITSLIHLYLIIERKYQFNFSTFQLTKNSKENFFYRIKKILFIIIDILFTLPRFFFNKKRYFIFSRSSDFFYFNNKKEDRIFKELMNILDSNYLYFFNAKHRVKTITREYSSIFTFFLMAKVISPFIKIKWSQNIYKIDGDIKKYGYNPDGLEKRVRMFFALCMIYKIYFKLKRPQAIFINAQPQVRTMAMGHVCKSLGIPIIELQHGIINKYLSDDGLYSGDIPRNKRFLPDYLFYYALPKNINNDNFYLPRKKCINTGHCYFEHLFNSHNRSHKKYNNYLLITLQGDSYHKSIPFLMEAAEKMPEFNFVFLARNCGKAFEGLTLPSNAFLEVKYNFYELVSDCKIHVTCYSTCALEAHAINKPNILLDLLDGGGINLILDYDLDSKIVSCVQEVDEFINKVRHYKLYKEDRNNEKKVPFIMFNHSERLRNALEAVLKIHFFL